VLVACWRLTNNVDFEQGARRRRNFRVNISIASPSSPVLYAAGHRVEARKWTHAMEGFVMIFGVPLREFHDMFHDMFVH